MLVVSDSSAIIALTRICRLNVLKDLFGTIMIPRAVWSEVSATDKPGSEKVVNADFMEVLDVPNRGLVNLLKETLDEGEAEAIALAVERSADLLIIDDAEGRRTAKELGLRVIGTLGVLALAKYRGVVPEVRPIVDELMRTGFWISKDIVDRLIRELGEA